MRDDVAQKLVRLRNEVRALKSTAILSGENVPVYENRVQWNGEIDGSEAMEGLLLAAFEMKFRRTDGILKTPMVDFAYETNPATKYPVMGMVTKCTDDSVTFHILFDIYDFDGFRRMWDEPTLKFNIIGHTALSIVGAAYSIVPGVLSIERVYTWI